MCSRLGMQGEADPPGAQDPRLGWQEGQATKPSQGQEASVALRPQVSDAQIQALQCFLQLGQWHFSGERCVVAPPLSQDHSIVNSQTSASRAWGVNRRFQPRIQFQPRNF